jgi:hypothetical protein
VSALPCLVVLWPFPDLFDVVNVELQLVLVCHYLSLLDATLVVFYTVVGSHGASPH